MISEAIDVELLRYAIQIKRVAYQWNLLVATLERSGLKKDHIDYGAQPWVLLADLNGIVKEQLKPTQLLSALEIELASAGFDVAVEFGRVELASDFLKLIPTPCAVRIREFLHRIRMALQWGTWAIDAPAVGKWLEIARTAICNCPDWGSLDQYDRFNCHEIMMGRMVKAGATLKESLRAAFLSNLVDPAADDEMERAFASSAFALSVGAGEITLHDLRERLLRSAKDNQAPITIMSLFIARDFLSYQIETAHPTNREVITQSGVTQIADLGICLEILLSNRNSFSFARSDELEDAVGWPLELRLWFQGVISGTRLNLTGGPSYILLAVNMPYQGLPWQHLVADAVEFSAVSPLVSIMPNFGVLLARKDPGSEKRKLELVCFPPLNSEITDPVVRSAVEPLLTDLQKFRDNPRFALAYITAHGHEDDEVQVRATSISELVIPQFAVGEDQSLLVDKLTEGLHSDILCLLVCAAGAPRASFFNDVGGILSSFLMEKRGVTFASIADVSPSAAVTLGRNILGCLRKEDAMLAYRQALLSNPECYLFNAYGLPPAVLLQADAIKTTNA